VLQQGTALHRLLLSGIRSVQSKNCMLAFSLQHHSSSQWIPGSPGQDQRASPASPCPGQGLLPASPPPLALQVRGFSPGDRPPPSVSSNSSSSSSPLRFTPIPLLTPCPLALLVAQTPISSPYTPRTREGHASSSKHSCYRRPWQVFNRG